MIVIARVRLTKPFLGDSQPGRDGHRTFRRKGSMIAVNEAAWREQFHTAAAEIPMDVDTRTIVPPQTLLPASIHTFVRTFSQVKTEQFESFRGGTVLTLEFLLRNTLPKAPTVPQFYDLLSFVGTYLGLSPWGSKFGFGRFEVLAPEDETSSKLSGNGDEQLHDLGADQRSEDAAEAVR